MIKVVFLASVRERLNCTEMPFDTGRAEISVTELVELLALRGELWRQVLLDDRVLVAVNQQMSRADVLIRDGDEVAFFPPVTGG